MKVTFGKLQLSGSKVCLVLDIRMTYSVGAVMTYSAGASRALAENAVPRQVPRNENILLTF